MRIPIIIPIKGKGFINHGSGFNSFSEIGWWPQNALRLASTAGSLLACQTKTPASLLEDKAHTCGDRVCKRLSNKKTSPALDFMKCRLWQQGVCKLPYCKSCLPASWKLTLLVCCGGVSRLGHPVQVRSRGRNAAHHFRIQNSG